MERPAPTIFTIGHSTRSAEEFAAILHAHGIRAIADVRLIPKSRRYPHFNHEELARWLPEAGIAYLPFKHLGGRRRPAKDSVNVGWRNESFRGYADFMQTAPFVDALTELLTAAAERPTATMCAEAVPWRCHRSLISDALLVRGWRVLDVTSATKAAPHKLTRFAKVDGLRVVYPSEEPQLFDAMNVREKLG
jgi:uncharacterized protein (DUF488 family)